jgi:WD40 repeat protein
VKPLWCRNYEATLFLQVVSAISIDGPGARIATGSHDYDVKIWDFGGMNARLEPFKTFEPSESYPVCRQFF